MKKTFLFSALLIFLDCFIIQAQDLDKLLGTIAADTTPSFTVGTFKGTTVISGQSVEVPGQGDMQFNISHRFGAVSGGLYTFFGLDQGTTRLGLDYGIKDVAGISVGRSNYEKTYDGGIKIKLVRQQTGLKNIPFTLSLYTAVFIRTMKWEDPERNNLFSSRLSYCTQFLLASKISRNLSLQLSPSWVHINLVETAEDQNNVFSVGMSGRYKVAKKVSLNGEYFYLLPGPVADNFANSFSLGVDLETGGHVFQLHFTNSQIMFAKGFITETEGSWLDGEIFIGFNIYRIFPLGKKGKNLK
jgi:hypothetical protein